MAARLYLDTHAIVWLHQGELAKFSRSACDMMENAALVYSPIVMFELQYLKEIGRLIPSPKTILTDLRRDIGLEVCTQPYVAVMEAACTESWTRDPFDRTIVAQARLQSSPLISRDHNVQKNYSAATW